VQVEKGPFSTPKFAAFGKSAVLLANLNAGMGEQRKRFEAWGGEAVPYMVFLDPQGKVIAPFRGPHKVAEFERARGFAQTYLDLRETTDASLEQRLKLLEAQVELGRIKASKAHEALKAETKASPKERKRLVGVISDVEVLEVWYSEQPRTSVERGKVGRRFLALYQGGTRPQRKVAVEAFYLLVLPAAAHKRDAKTYEAALGDLRAWLDARGASTRVLGGFEKQLRELQR
jgi:hypothetical protein